ncbi:hypothetical protein [Rheinheimera sp.]|uniref:hypothetical protein n=1 Tax=Rheinheimera sp. TaxID=1869214 RepID=UPI00307D69C6
MKAVVVTMSLLLASVQAATVDDELQRCRQISQDLPRLLCYDQIGQPAKTVAETVTTKAVPLVVAQQPVQAAAASPAPEKTAEQDFGIEHRAAPPEDLPEAVTVVLTKIATAPHGQKIFTFDNGQVWRQITKESFVAKTGETYQLTRGVLNSFFLGQQDSPRKTRVRRDQ